MQINKIAEGNKVTFAITGCLDTTTSPDLQKEVEALAAETKELFFDFAKLEYISSAGLRVMLTANKKMMAAGGEMTITGVVPAVKEVFDMTGFSDILNIA